MRVTIIEPLLSDMGDLLGRGGVWVNIEAAEQTHRVNVYESYSMHRGFRTVARCYSCRSFECQHANHALAEM